MGTDHLKYRKFKGYTRSHSKRLMLELEVILRDIQALTAVVINNDVDDALAAGNHIVNAVHHLRRIESGYNQKEGAPATVPGETCEHHGQADTRTEVPPAG